MSLPVSGFNLKVFLMVVALTFFHVAIIFIAAAIFVAAAVNDVLSYRIPNYLCGLLFLLFPLYVATSPVSLDWHRNIVVAGLVLMVGFAAFSGGLMGAGDIKLLSVASLWAGPHLIAILLIVTAFAGGIESLAVAALRAVLHKTIRSAHSSKVQIPYGVAIATGSLAILGLIIHPILLPE
jgi:prepilin peptidase CpaA